MPIYEYICFICINEFEKIVGLNEKAPTCPICDSPVAKKISLTSFRLKGGGWYSDAYSGKSNKAPIPKSTGEKD
jgi:putative FmdB family regulatory protein